MKKPAGSEEVRLECPRCGEITPVRKAELVAGRSVECRRCGGEVVVTRADGEEGPDGWILALPPDESDEV